MISEVVFPQFCYFELFVNLLSVFDSGMQAKHHIVNLLIDRCADSDRRTRKFACFAVRSWHT